MPNIRQFEAPQLGLQPTEIGVEATAAAARRGGAFYNQAAEATQNLGQRAGSAIRDAGDAAVDYVAHQEISHGAATFAQLHANLTDQWNNTVKNADPNDTSVAGKFNETVLQPALDKFKGAFNTEKGQQWAEGHVDSLREHMFQKGAADMSTLAGDAVRVNVRQMTSAWTNTAFKDPSSTDFLLRTAESSINGIVSTSAVKGTDAARIRTEVMEKAKEDIVRAGMASVAKSGDENAVADFASRWPQYANAQEGIQYAKAAKAYRRADQQDQDRAERLQDKHIQDASTDRRDEIVKDAFSDKPSVSMRDVLSDQTLTAPDREHLVHVIQQEGKAEPLARVSHATWTDLMGRLRAEDDTRLTSDKPIWDAMAAGKLNRADFNSLRAEWANMKSPDGEALSRDRADFFKQFAPSIDTGMKEQNPTALGAQRIYAAQQDARRQEALLKSQGKDPHSLYDPSSPNFLGRQIGKWRPTLQDQADYAAQIKADAGAKADAALAKQRANTNLTAPGNTITGVERIDQPPGAKTFVPPNNWQWSPSRSQYRDPSGVLYDVSGNKVK